MLKAGFVLGVTTCDLDAFRQCWGFGAFKVLGDVGTSLSFNCFSSTAIRDAMAAIMVFLDRRTRGPANGYSHDRPALVQHWHGRFLSHRIFLALHARHEHVLGFFSAGGVPRPSNVSWSISSASASVSETGVKDTVGDCECD